MYIVLKSFFSKWFMKIKMILLYRFFCEKPLIILEYQYHQLLISTLYNLLIYYLFYFLSLNQERGY